MNVASPAPQMKRDWLDWPFFGESHRAFAGALDRFVASGAIAAIDHEDVDASCRKLVRALGEAGLLDAAVAPPTATRPQSNSRSVCLARETLAYHDGLADFAFAMQGLGSGAVAIAGSDEQRRLVLAKGPPRRVARRFRALGKGGWLRCRGHGLLGARGRERISPGRREDLDLERRDR